MAQRVLDNQKSTHSVQEARDFVSLPFDFTLNNVPAVGLAWLQRYHVTEEERKRFSIGYSPRLDRLILPVFRGEELIFYQGRYLGHKAGQPKYLSISKKADNVWFEIRQQDSANTPLVIVEDILSAIAVARAGFCAVALLGSYLKEGLILHLLQKGFRDDGVPVFVWLDPDKKSEAVRFARRLSSFGVNASSVLHADEDPKVYTPEEIRGFIKQQEVGDSDDG